MRILYGITKSNFGGAQRYVFELALEAQARGHEVGVICGGEGPLTEKLRNENIRVFTLHALGRDISPLDDARAFFSLFGILGEFKPDIFHINSSKMGGVGGLAGRIMRTPKIIFTAHGWAFNEPRPWLQKIIIKFLAWITILLSHKTICVSEKTRADVSNLPFIKNKLSVIYNGIDKFRLMPKSQARDKFAIGIPSDVLVIGAIAELHRIKGLDILLYAWQKFVRRFNARLVIIGGGEEREYLENLSQSLGISDSVIFKGFIDNARTLISGFDIFIMPSRSEAMPYAALEAGTAGLPVIASEVGGVPEIIESGKNGILVAPEDPEAIFSSLVLLEDNPDLRKRLGKELKNTIQTKFSNKEMLRRTFELYSS
jgi:glycosyltransferase involved in cell wall biosynthesis